MNNLSLKNFSLLGLTLMGVSALTSAFIPAKKAKAINDRTPNNGIGVQSTIGGVQTPAVPETVVFQALGSRSYTATINASNPNGSATSQDDDGTETSIRSWSTFDGTTAPGLEDVNVIHND